MKHYTVGFVGSSVMLIILLTVILGWSLVLGWILTIILPFELFEGTLLVMIATGIVVYGLANISKSDDDDVYDDFSERYPIPVDRFAKSEAEGTWENYIRYEIANAVKYEFAQSGVVSEMESVQQEALAIRMSDAAVAILKRKSTRSTKIEITESQLRRQLEQMGSQPDDERVVDVAIESINQAIVDTPIQFIMRKKAWSQSTPALFDPL
jgi:hypothetical protein